MRGTVSDDSGARLERLIGLYAATAAAFPSRSAAAAVVLDYARTLLSATGSFLARVDEKPFFYEFVSGSLAAFGGMELAPTTSLVSACAHEAIPLRCDDAATDTRVDRDVCRRVGIASVVVVPIAFDGRMTYVLGVVSDVAHAFDAHAVLELNLAAVHFTASIRACHEYERVQRSDADAQATIDHLPSGVVVFGPDRRVRRHNAAAEAILEASSGDVRTWSVAALRDVLDQNGAPLAEDELPVARAFATGRAWRGVLLNLDAHGARRRWIAASAVPIVGDDGPSGVVLSVRDVTELKTLELEQRDLARRLRALHLIASNVEGDRGQQIDAALELGMEELDLDWGYFGRLEPASQELVIDNVRARFGDTLLERGTRIPLARAYVARALKTRNVLILDDLRAEAERNPGMPVYGDWRAYIAAPIVVAGEPYGAIGFTAKRTRVVSFTEADADFIRIMAGLIGSAIERADQRARLDALAYFDALTGLPNRVLLFDRIEQAIRVAGRYGPRFALMYLDLDGFKEINDRHGHLAGDRVLRVVAERLRRELRGSDTVARFGGDEFVVLAPHMANVSDARELAVRLVAAVATPIAGDGVAHAITVSVGIAMYPPDGTNVEELVRTADRAMYEAKRRGKNRVLAATDLVDA